ncbi:Uncharacterised protein [Mycobacteroides abscessus subsp. abscessus]|nr:Uncharacterised protein [Mycobacteroides abscessus subsp. abscessus]
MSATPLVSSVARPGSRNGLRGSLRPPRSSTARAAMAIATAPMPSTMAASFKVVGLLMNRVSTTTWAVGPPAAGTLRSVNKPVT